MEYTIAIIIAYAYLAFSFQTIAKKTGTDNAINAWIPVLNLILVAKIAQKPNWFGFLLLVPIVNFAIAIYLIIEIIKITQKPAWLGILLIIPGLGIIVPGYIAFSSGTAPVSKNMGNLIIGMIVSSFVLSIILYYALTLMPIEKNIEENKAFSQDKISSMEKNFNKTPKTNKIKNLVTHHENIRKERVKTLDVLNQIDKAIEKSFPEIKFSEITAFKSKMNVYASALKLFYNDHLMKKPEGSEDAFGTTAVKFNDDPFSQFKEDLDSEENCRLALKKCLITTELLNALDSSIKKLKDLAENENADPAIARFKTQKPVCAIIKLTFPGLKADAITKVRDNKNFVGIDGSGFYTTLPFRLEIALDPELHTLFYREISNPSKLNIKHNDLNVLRTEEDTEEEFLKRELSLFQSIFKSENGDNDLSTSFDTAVRQRYGLRFDFLSATVNLTQVNETIDKKLLTDPETRKKYIDMFPDMIGRDKDKPLPPKGEDPTDHKGRWANCYKVQETLSKVLTKELPIKPAYLRTVYQGAAIDFTLNAYISNVLYEEMVIAGALEATVSEDE